MGKLRILNGSFQAGRATFDGRSIELRGPAGRETVPLSSVADVRRVGGEGRVDGAGTLKLAAAGSLIGGIAAGAMAGGITGPVGALIGAAAGAVVTGRRIYPINTVTLVDGRWFTAVAAEVDWSGFHEGLRHARPPMIDVTPAPPAPAGRPRLLTKLRQRLLKLPKP